MQSALTATRNPIYQDAAGFYQDTAWSYHNEQQKNKAEIIVLQVDFVAGNGKMLCPDKVYSSLAQDAYWCTVWINFPSLRKNRSPEVMRLCELFTYLK